MIKKKETKNAQTALVRGSRRHARCGSRQVHIFIDPPYNTRSAFEHYDDNLEPSQWLSMMYPRLELLRDLLSEDGSIWVTIDDNEGHYLKVLMDEVLGRRNFIANVIWQKKYSPQNDAEFFSPMHDHVLVYSKSIASWKRNLVPRTPKQDKAYKNPDGDLRGLWQASDLTGEQAGRACNNADSLVPSPRRPGRSRRPAAEGVNAPLQPLAEW